MALLAISRGPLLLGILACMACPGRSSPISSSEPGPAAGSGGQPGTVIHFNDWGVGAPGEVGFVSIGLLKGSEPVAKLVVYDLRRTAPSRKQPDTVVWRSAAPMLNDGAYLLSHFDSGNYNRLGGTFSSFAREPSRSSAELVPGKGLQLRWNRKEDGFAGLWMHMFDDRVPPEDRTYLHTGAAAYLHFEIRGAAGSEDLSLRVADRVWDAKGDSLPVGKIALFVPEGRVTRDWQAARVPLSALPDRVDHEELASLILAADTPGTGQVYIRNLALLAAADTQVPAAPAQRPEVSRPLRRAIWVWQTRRIVEDPAELEALLELCAAEGIDDVFLQLLPAQAGRNRKAKDLEPMLALVEALHEQGLRVQALDGAPELALEAHHDEVLDTVRAVIDSNKRSEAVRRFDGIRFDNEPYLLPGFSGPGKEPILRAYLDGLDKAHALTMQANLPLGADIPFWFDGHDRFQEPVARLDGRPVSELVMDRVENIAIMAYRTKVYGPDGVIAHCLDELEYADLTGKDVLIALESVRLPDETLQEFTEGAGQGDFLLLRAAGGGKLEVTWFSAEQEALARSRLAQSTGARLLRMRFEATAPSDKLSFHKRSRRAMHEAMQRIADELSVHSSFSGFALHSFDALRKLKSE